MAADVAPQRLTVGVDAELRGLIAADDPHGELRLAWSANQTLRCSYDINCPQLAGAYGVKLSDAWKDAS